MRETQAQFKTRLGSVLACCGLLAGLLGGCLDQATPATMRQVSVVN